MSKYVKLEDAIHNINLEVTGRKEYTGDMKANLFFALKDLPTIEVSEDAVSREWLMKRWDEMSIRGRTEFDQEIMVAPSVVAKAKEGECPYFIDGVWCNLVGKEMKGADDE